MSAPAPVGDLPVPLDRSGWPIRAGAAVWVAHALSPNAPEWRGQVVRVFTDAKGRVVLEVERLHRGVRLVLPGYVTVYRARKRDGAKGA